jgi:hypothetical protein
MPGRLEDELADGDHRQPIGDAAGVHRRRGDSLKGLVLEVAARGT